MCSSPRQYAGRAGRLDLGIPDRRERLFYNQTAEVPSQPTPVVGVLGVLDDVSRRTPIGREAGHAISSGDLDEFGGSSGLTVHGSRRAPALTFAAERTGRVLIEASRGGPARVRA
jgi:phosphoribosylformylglycinamidine synthase